jgi:hypothetical protein
MPHPTAADRHAMMAVPTTRTCQVGAERRFLLKSQWPPRVGTFVIGHGCYIVHPRFSWSHRN